MFSNIFRKKLATPAELKSVVVSSVVSERSAPLPTDLSAHQTGAAGDVSSAAPITPKKPKKSATDLSGHLSQDLIAADLVSPRIKVGAGPVSSVTNHPANAIFAELAGRLVRSCMDHALNHWETMEELEKQSLRRIKEYAGFYISDLGGSENDQSSQYDQVLEVILSKIPALPDEITERIVKGTDHLGKDTECRERIVRQAPKLPFAFAIELFVADERRKRPPVANAQLVAYQQSVDEAVAAALAAERQKMQEAMRALMPYMGGMRDEIMRAGMLAQFQGFLSLTNSTLEEITTARVTPLLSKAEKWDSDDAKYILRAFLTPLRYKLVLILADICCRQAKTGDIQIIIAQKLIFDLCSNRNNTVLEIFETTMKILSSQMGKTIDQIWAQFNLFKDNKVQLTSENDQRQTEVLVTQDESKAFMRLFKKGVEDFLLTDGRAHYYWHCQVFPQGSVERNPQIEETTINSYCDRFSRKITDWLAQQQTRTSARPTPAAGVRLAQAAGASNVWSATPPAPAPAPASAVYQPKP